MWPGAWDRARARSSADARAAAAGADNQIGDVGAAALAEGVKASRTLTELNLRGECGRGVGPSLRGAVLMCALRRRLQTTRSAMSVPRRLRKARRRAGRSRNCRCGVSVAGGVGPSSRAGSVHARVAAAGAANQIGAVGAAALAEGVKASGTLTLLSLGGECGPGRGPELVRGAVLMHALRWRVQGTRSAMSVPRRSRRA